MTVNQNKADNNQKSGIVKQLCIIEHLVTHHPPYIYIIYIIYFKYYGELFKVLHGKQSIKILLLPGNCMFYEYLLKNTNIFAFNTRTILQLPVYYVY